MLFLILLIGLYAFAIVLFVQGIRLGSTDEPRLSLFLPGFIWMCAGWFPFFGLKVLKPNEALVLTLFGNYVGTLKGEGFYYVNPFCTAVNPAAATRLGQSGDVGDEGIGKKILIAGNAEKVSGSYVNKKISLKVMTLNNARQKVNDVLGNPVEIGVAVMWKVDDTAKAVFNVDNYKEYLSLQVDTAVRDIVKIYPYDIAPGIDTTGDGKERRTGNTGSQNHISCLCSRNRFGHAAEAAGVRGH